MNALFARLMNNRILLQTILLLKRLFVEENTLHMTYNSAASNLFCQLTMKFRSISKPVNLLAYSFIQVMSVVIFSFKLMIRVLCHYFTDFEYRFNNMISNIFRQWVRLYEPGIERWRNSFDSCPWNRKAGHRNWSRWCTIWWQRLASRSCQTTFIRSKYFVITLQYYFSIHHKFKQINCIDVNYNNSLTHLIYIRIFL